MKALRFFCYIKQIVMLFNAKCKKMKRLYIFLFAAFMLLSGLNVTAQAQGLSKKERKEWKKKKKSMSEAEFKRIVEENASLQGEVGRINKQLSTAQQEVSEKDGELVTLRDRIQTLQDRLGAAEQRASTAEAQLAAMQRDANKQDVIDSRTGGTRVARGVIFKVQIGAFKNKDLSKYFDKNTNFSGETGDDGLQRITLGAFTDYWEADTFKKYLREMGVTEAWIVPYKDGQRVPLKDVLEGVI